MKWLARVYQACSARLKRFDVVNLCSTITWRWSDVAWNEWREQRIYFQSNGMSSFTPLFFLGDNDIDMFFQTFPLKIVQFVIFSEKWSIFLRFTQSSSKLKKNHWEKEIHRKKTKEARCKHYSESRQTNRMRIATKKISLHLVVRFPLLQSHVDHVHVHLPIL